MGNRRRLARAVALIVLVTVATLRIEARGVAPRRGASRYDHLARIVVRLEARAISTTGQRLRLPAGTGFLFQLGNHVALITARHVVEAVDTLYARIPVGSGDALNVHTLMLPRDSWVFADTSAASIGGRSIRPVDLAFAWLPNTEA